MAITQFAHNDNDQSSAKSVHLEDDLSSATTATATTDNNSSNEHAVTLPSLSMYSTNATHTTATSLPKLSDSTQISVSSDTSSSCMDKDTLEATILNNAAVTQNDVNNGSDRPDLLTNLYGKRTCLSSSTNTYEKQDVEDKETIATIHALARTSLTDELDDDEQSIRRRSYRTNDQTIGKPQSQPHSRTISPHRPYTKSATSSSATLARHSQSKLNKSRWQQLVSHAGSAAGTTVAILSEESMKCLRYCLYWLQYATQHIQQQMHLLRLFLVSLATSSSTAYPSNQQQPSAASLSSIQNEIILTLRKVVDVVSQYAGAGLPTHAKASVRSFILQLPENWATLNTNRNTTTDDVPEHDDQVEETSAIKLLKFGGQSIEMLGSVSSVFSDSIDRAQLWLDRLRLVGGVPHRPMET
ncbi:transcription factor Opi1-domain-containing protein [Absidia repens]|uniref:Transcription factor Opi1-domain-containing protein n=1 Tax=Absidia repens TaxID=90262 RepID=A0A1X2IN27_9FUNG|nr:transcription factor Opi1-domain-containing protein [Absidia repens]